jgi:hypothetical protein
MFGFRGSYDFLYNSFVKAGGGSSLALCLLFYAALNMSCACPCPYHERPLTAVPQVPAGHAQARERGQRLRGQDVASARGQ